MSSEPTVSLEGKKVYFLYPNSVIQNDMVAELIKAEYEIYLLKDHEKAVNLFHRHPDSIVFINVDEVLSEEDWQKYVQKLQSDLELRALKIGVLTYNNDPELAEKYLMDLMVPAGFVKLGLGLKESTGIILRVLEANEARGRRKFLRVKCIDKYSTLNLKHDNKMINGNILDISSVGMACVFDPDPGFPVHGVTEPIQLRLKGALALVSGVVMGTRLEGGKKTYVLLFDQNTTPETKVKIRHYMQWALQNQIEAESENQR